MRLDIVSLYTRAWYKLRSFYLTKFSYCFLLGQKASRIEKKNRKVKQNIFESNI